MQHYVFSRESAILRIVQSIEEVKKQRSLDASTCSAGEQAELCQLVLDVRAGRLDQFELRVPHHIRVTLTVR
jgi:hypothetical protein